MKHLSLIVGMIFFFSFFAFGQDIAATIGSDGKQIVNTQKEAIAEPENANIPVSNRLSPTGSAENPVEVQPSPAREVNVEEAEKQAVSGGKVDVADTRKVVIPSGQKSNVKVATPAKKTPKN